MKKRICSIPLLLFILLAACTKKDTAASKTEMLTTGTWSLSGLVSDLDGNGTYEKDDYAGYTACYKDNFYTFRTNGDLESNEGGSKCNSGDPQMKIIRWQFTNNEINLLIDGITYDLVELKFTLLKIKLNLGNGMSFVSTFTKR